MPHTQALKILDIMKRDVFTISETCSVGSAAWALRRRGLHSAPVCDDGGQVVGVVTRADLARADEGDDQSPPKAVAEAMTPAVLALEPDDLAMDAARFMATHRIDQVAVVNARGELLGMVSAGDCVRAIDRHEAVTESRKRGVWETSPPRRNLPTPPAPLPSIPRSPDHVPGYPDTTLFNETGIGDQP